MDCPGCGEANKDDARFCLICGTALDVYCSNCGRELDPRARFCDGCGTSIAPAAAQPTSAARKVVTVVFVDLTGSTALEERMDAESVRSILDRFYAAMRTEIERHGGRVVKFTGDGVMAAFGVPDVHEDDAARAVDAAIAMREELVQLASDLSLDLSLKVGINTGEVVVSETDEDVVGDAVNVAARLEGAAQSGEVLVGQDTWRLTRGTSRYEPVEPLTLKGKSEPVNAYRLLSVDERTADSAAAPFVGRDNELRKLLDVYNEVVAAKAARLVTIIGSPGLGKTRLAREMAAALGDRAFVVETRCDPAGESTFAPVADALRAGGITGTEEEVVATLAAGLPEDDPERDRIAARAATILGVGVPGTTEETFWALRRLLEATASTLPMVIVVDDVHWGEPLLLDLLEHLAEWIRTAPVMLVVTGRPELRDIRPSLAEGGRAADVIALEGLNPSATAQLAMNLLGAEDLPQGLLARIPESTEGNPLFVRELVRMLVDDGVLLRTADGWTVTIDVEAIQVPPTIQSLLSARVDRLRKDERAVVELASVVGKEFYRGALYHLAGSDLKGLVDGCLESLRRKELVEPAGTYWIDEPVYRFHHVLIRDAAYRRLLKEARADLHERVAGWLELKTADVLGEHDELVGYHLEQAHDYKRQLGRPDDELGLRAAELLRTAAQRALDRDDLPAAAALSGRALDCLPTDDVTRPEILLIRCEALLSMGDVALGSAAVDEFERLTSTERLRAWATCFSGHLANLTAPERSVDTEARVASAAAELAALGDDAGAAKAHTVRALTLAKRGRFAECEAALDDALTAARAAGDRRRITATLGLAPHAQVWGPNVVSRAGGRCLDVVRLLRITTGSLAVEATSLRCQAVLESFRGRADAARRMLRSARRTLTELGLQHELLETEHFAGIVELVDGDAAAAIEHFRTAYEGLRKAGVDVLAAQAAALLARAHLRVGEEDEAAEFVETSERLASDDQKATIDALGVKAELLARRGEFEDARRLAEEAVELAGRTDALFDHGSACRSLAVVLRAAGDADGARRAEERALALFERKGATALIESQTMTPSSPVDSAVIVASNALVNRCVRAVWLIDECINRVDLDGALAIHADEVEAEDRRSGLGSKRVGKELFAEEMAQVMHSDNHVMNTPVATRGDNLALTSTAWRVGRSAYVIDHLSLNELNDEGLIVRTVRLDPTDLDAAIDELDERYIAGEGSTDPELIWLCRSWLQTYQTEDFAHLRPLFTDDFSVTDHRPASFGVLNADELVQWMQEMTNLASERVAYPAAVYALAPGRGIFRIEIHVTTPEGASVETIVLVLMESRDGRMSRIEGWLPEQLDEALARFNQLEEGELAGTLEPNRCARITSEYYDFGFNAGDWARVRALLSDDVVIDDRRQGLRHTFHGADAYISHNQTITRDTRITLSLVATRGERLALHRVLAAGSRPGSWEVEFLALSGLDEEDRLSLLVSFDPSALDEAIDELDALYMQGEGSVDPELVRFWCAMTRAYAAGDGAGLRALLDDDLVIVDHREASTAVGSLSPDEFARYLQQWSTLTSDCHVYAGAVHALARGRGLFRLELHGVTADGGLVETVNLSLVEGSAPRFSHLEVFAPAQLPAALARFEELGRVTEELSNEATKVARRVFDCIARRDWEAFAQLQSQDTVSEDRRRGLQGRTDGIEAGMEHAKAAASIGMDIITAVPIATRGERLALMRMTFGSTRSDSFGVDLVNLWEIDEAGRTRYSIVFDSDALDEAFKELDDRYERGEGAGTAFRTQATFFRALNERDLARARSLFHDDVVVVDHRPVSLGTLTPDALIAAADRLPEVIPGHKWSISEVLTVSPRGGVFVNSSTGSTSEGTPVDYVRGVSVMVLRGEKIGHLEVFPAEAKSVALARFEELERTTAPKENDAVHWQNVIRNATLSGDWSAVAELYAENVAFDDRRSGLGFRAEGRDAVLEHAKLSVPGTTYRLDVLATRGERLALSRLVATMRAGYEVEALFLTEFDEQGKEIYVGLFDSDDLEGAFAELDARYPAGEADRSQVVERHWAPENAASRVAIRSMEHAMAGNWDAWAALYAPNIKLVDARRGLGFEANGLDAVLEFARVGTAIATAGFTSACIAAWGERLAITRHALGDPSLNRWTAEILNLHELDEEGRFVYAVTLEPNDLDAAFDILLERYADGEGHPYRELLDLVGRLFRAYRERDWDSEAVLIAQDFVFVDHQPAGAGTLEGPEELMRYFKAMVDLAPDYRGWIVEFVRIETERMLARLVTRGTSSDEGPIELEVFSMWTRRGDKLARIEQFSADQLDEALARFDELERTAASDVPENLAVKTENRVIALANADDIEALASLYTEDAVLEDRRRGLRTRVVGGQAMADFNRYSTPGTTLRGSTIATRGDRLVLSRLIASARSGFEVELLVVRQVDEQGKNVLTVLFDPDDFDAAMTELEELYIAGEGAPYEAHLRTRSRGLKATMARDWDGVRRDMAEDVVVVDHRPASLGERRGVDEFIEATRALFELVPDFRLCFTHYLVLKPDRALIAVRSTGMNEHGGEIDMSNLALSQVRGETTIRLEYFPKDQLEAALARFDELGRAAGSVPETSAVRSHIRNYELLRAGDWDAHERMHAEDCVVEDRRRGLRNRIVGRKAAVEHSRISNRGIVLRSSPIATRGESLALARETATTRTGFEVELLVLFQYEEDLHQLTVLFDPDDLDAALSELDVQYLAGEAAPYADVWRAALRSVVPYNTRDWDALAAILTPDFVAVDHRPAGGGEVAGTEEWVAFIKELVALAPDVHLEALAVHRLTDWGGIVQWNVHGTNADGGEIELPSLSVFTVRDGVVDRMEQFSVEDLDDALARFEELRPARETG